MDDHEFKFVTFAHLEYHMHLWLIKLWICKPHIIIIIIIIIILIIIIIIIVVIIIILSVLLS